MRSQLWDYVRGLAAPLLLCALFIIALIGPLQTWLGGYEKYDENLLREWVQQTSIFRETISDMARDYLRDLNQARRSDPHFDPLHDLAFVWKVEKMQEHLRSMGDPTKMFAGQLPGFPVIYRLQLFLVTDPATAPLAVTWDSDQPRDASQYRVLRQDIDPRAWLEMQYTLHAYNEQPLRDQEKNRKVRWVGALAIAGLLISFLWVYLVQRRRREIERQRLLAQQRIDQAEHLRLEEELRRQEAEGRREETERKLLEQQLATQEAERQTLELKSQLYASIGIMAGSYAHNIKNLLIRPNDLLRRCLAVDGLSGDQEHMIQEVRQTLGTVTERLQQILKTVRRDPTRSELFCLDLNQIVRDLQQTWVDLAWDKWKLTLTLESAPEPLWIKADLSHIQQAVENLIFNARDATFEMRNYLRGQAHRQHADDPVAQRNALIEAAAWKGAVTLRTRRQEDRAILEIVDNGIGMDEATRRRCTETHFSTKRDNAVYEGNSTGMGLGLSFVSAILNHHGAMLEIESEPLKGSLFRAVFPLATNSEARCANDGESRASPAFHSDPGPNEAT
jgi:signal transduction histidine kinase